VAHALLGVPFLQEALATQGEHYVCLCMQMMYQLAIRLRDLHALGYVHRDLKPPNVMWLPRRNRWTIIGFGCAARTGEAAGLAFTWTHAPPEVINAHRNKERTMVAEVPHLLQALLLIADLRACSCYSINLHVQPVTG
jgi:serine/threonine protein kinase